MPWKNGGGVTSEIMSQTGPSGIDWRLSLADVTSNGPYSLFPGMARVLTVVSGQGTQLIDTQTDEAQIALPHKPIRFSGDQHIQGHLIEGAIQNFNLIFNPLRTVARVTVVDAQRVIIPMQRSDSRIAIYSLSGRVVLEGAGDQQIHAGDTFVANPVDIAGVRGMGDCNYLYVTMDPVLNETDDSYR